MRIFVNNVDGFLAGALCADLKKLSHHIVGTRKGRSDDLLPPTVKRIVPRVEVRKLLKIVAACDVVVYDLHDCDLEELELVVRALQVSEMSHNMTFILISSVGVWTRTQRNYEEVPVEPVEIPGAEEADAAEGEGEQTEAAEARVETEGDPDGDGEATDDAKPAQPAEEPKEPVMRPAALKSEDYTRRVPTPKFQEWKAIETQVLSLKEKGNVRPYVVCAGIPYGNGEDAFLSLFKAAWQSKSTLRVIGEGRNYIPLVHARDLARLTRHVIEVKPELDYHLAVDRGDVTQRDIVQAVAKQFGLPSEVKSVTVAEALLAELADILTMDLRLEPSALMEVPYVPPPPVEEVAEGDEGEATAEGASPSAPGDASSAAASPTAAGEELALADKIAEEEETEGEVKPLPFRWWSEQGFVTNIGKVASEFVRWRCLSTLRFCVVGAPGSGSAKLGERLAALYQLPCVNVDDIIEEPIKLDSPLAQTLQEQLESEKQAIAANLANPKSPGPFTLSNQLRAQLLELAMASRPTEYRGFVLTGLQTSDEANYFFLEQPPPGEAAAPAGKGAAPAAAKPEGGDPKPSFVPDIVIFVQSSDEASLARAQADENKPFEEKEFGILKDLWKKEGDAQMSEFFSTKMAIECLQVSADEAQKELEESAAAAAEAAAEEGKEAPPPPDAATLASAAASSWAWIESACRTTVAHLESKKTVCNFLPPPFGGPNAKVDERSSSKDNNAGKDALDAEAAAAAKAAEEAETKAKKARLEEQARIEVIRKDELARLEKHSEPLRQYLMRLVVPALTSGLVEVCRSQPEDPAGYLAEYLEVYSEVSRERLAAKAASDATANAAS
eukprot:TRINITY_DN78606_c0_g1_i1.p1 TRINITY_DN78606_c0_g1~~TRINITY_DN78606_c0_g1_i1.p1  ORF type:complete len:842 (-),score=219.01 TRINITY_DN78606_c0_g1_i1:90-2615(-)